MATNIELWKNNPSSKEKIQNIPQYSLLNKTEKNLLDNNPNLKKDCNTVFDKISKSKNWDYYISAIETNIALEKLRSSLSNKYNPDIVS